MGPIRSYRDLIVWQKGKELSKRIYRATEKMPRSELFGLTGQMRRAGVSIPSNIAEGYNRKTGAEHIRGLRIASGSQAELSTQWEIATEPGMIRNDPTIPALMVEVDRLLFALIQKVDTPKNESILSSARHLDTLTPRHLPSVSTQSPPKTPRSTT